MITNILLFEFRNFGYASVSFEAVNFFFGKNASGKTSILEAIYFTKYQKSFRAKSIDQCIRKGNAFFGLKLELENKKILIDKHLDIAVKFKIDNEAGSKAELDSELPFVELLSEHYENLVIGAKEVRRKFIDDLMFHMEPTYKKLHRKYQKCLDERNHLLKINSLSDDDFWVKQLAILGEELTKSRELALERYFKILKTNLSDTSLEDIEFLFNKGYEGDLLKSLVAHRDIDCLKRSTTTGAHKCDLVILSDDEKSEYFLSRGQIKLLNMILVLTKIDLIVKSGQVVILLLDDYFSEMDDMCLGFFKNWLKQTKTNGINLQLFINAVSEKEFARMEYLDFESFNVFELADGKIEKVERIEKRQKMSQSP